VGSRLARPGGKPGSPGTTVEPGGIGREGGGTGSPEGPLELIMPACLSLASKAMASCGGPDTGGTGTGTGGTGMAC